MVVGAGRIELPTRRLKVRHRAWLHSARPALTRVFWSKVAGAMAPNGGCRRQLLHQKLHCSRSVQQ